MTCELREKKSCTSNDEVMDISFEEYDKKNNIKLRQPPREGIPGFPVNRVGAFRWITKDEVQIVELYEHGKKPKAPIIRLNVFLHNIGRRLRR
jgi:hypothetical protein